MELTQESGSDAVCVCLALPAQEDMSESSGPEGSAQGSGAWADETQPQRERRYATRQATAAKRRTSYNPALDMDKVSHPAAGQLQAQVLLSSVLWPLSEQAALCIAGTFIGPYTRGI